MDKERDIQFIKALRNKLQSLKALREPLWNKRVEASAYCSHRVESGGCWQDKRVYNTTLKDAIKQSIGGFMGYLVSPTQEWIRLGANLKTIKWQNADNIYGLNDYLYSIQKEILKSYMKSNFYTVIRMMVKDSMVQGTGCVSMYEEGDNLSFQCIDPQQLYIDEGVDKKIDTVFREYELTIQQAYKKYGERLPKEIIEHYRNGDYNGKVKITECCYPSDCIWLSNEQYEEYKVNQFKYTWIVFCDVESGYILERKGCENFPFVIFRWSRDNIDNPYGVGMVMDILPEVKTLDKISRMLLTSFEKAINPPMLVSNGMMDIDLNPNAVNYGDVSQAPVIIGQTQDVNGMREYKAELQNYIYNSMLTTLFTTLMRTQDNQYRTATEVNELKGEALSLLSSALGNLHNDVIVPIVTLTIKIMGDNKILPNAITVDGSNYIPVPKELEKEIIDNLQIELEGPLIKRMQNHLSNQGVNDGLAMLTAVVQGFGDSTPLLNVDMDEMVRIGLRGKGVPENCIREKEDVKRDKMNIAKQNQQRQMLAQQEQESRTVANIGNGLGREQAERYINNRG